MMNSFSDQSTTGQRVLLLGNYRPTLTLARELSERGYFVMSGLHGCDMGAEHSLFVRELWHHPRLADQPDRFVLELAQFVKSNKVDIIYPVLEEYVAYFASKKLMEVAGALVASASPDLVTKSLDKSYMMKLAGQLDVPTAPFSEATSFEQLKQQAARLNFPLVIRPRSSANRLGDQKAIIVDNAAELERRFAHWPMQQAGLILQEKVSGRRYNVYFSANRGRILRMLHTVISATDKLDGTGLAVEGITVEPMSDLQTYTEQLAQALDYSGVGCAQYIVDEPSGYTSFLEINPRIVGSHAIAEYAGLELSEFPIILVTGRDVDPTKFVGEAGIRYVWSTGALQAAKTAWKEGQISSRELVGWILQIVYASVRAKVHMVFAPIDPKPAFMAMVELMPSWQNLLRRVFNPSTLETDKQRSEHLPSSEVSPDQSKPLKQSDANFEQS